MFIAHLWSALFIKIQTTKDKPNKHFKFNYGFVAYVLNNEYIS